MTCYNASRRDALVARESYLTTVDARIIHELRPLELRPIAATADCNLSQPCRRAASRRRPCRGRNPSAARARVPQAQRILKISGGANASPLSHLAARYFSDCGEAI